MRVPPGLVMGHTTIGLPLDLLESLIHQDDKLALLAFSQPTLTVGGATWSQPEAL